MFLTLIVFIPTLSFSQQTDSVATVSLPRITAKFDGVIKTKFEVSTDAGVMRFNVRNSRLGVRGDIGRYAGYRVQVEFSNEGNFAPLDLYGILLPAKGLSVYFGQTSIPFDNQYIISPAEMMFTNRAFVGKYFTPGSRDIGGVVSYEFPVAFPLEAQAGMFNGGKINDPQWTDEPSYALRVIAGSMDGFRTSVKMYRYNSETIKLMLFGADVHYANDRFRVEAEATTRRAKQENRDLFGTYIQGVYVIDFNSVKMFRNLYPAFRWDAMGYEVFDAGFDVNRLTFGLNFGLALKHFDSTLRIDYEQYFLRRDSFAEFDDRDPHVADNKVSVELLLRF